MLRVLFRRVAVGYKELKNVLQSEFTVHPIVNLLYSTVASHDLGGRIEARLSLEREFIVETLAEATLAALEHVAFESPKASPPSLLDLLQEK